MLYDTIREQGMQPEDLSANEKTEPEPIRQSEAASPRCLTAAGCIFITWDLIIPVFCALHTPRTVAASD